MRINLNRRQEQAWKAVPVQFDSVPGSVFGYSHSPEEDAS
jgi:hypothetical protein